MERYADEGLITSNHVQGETWTLINRREGHAAAVNFLDAIAHSQRISVMHVQESVAHAAFRWLRARGDREYSFVDATSFALMRELGIDQALAFDADFPAAGFIEPR